MTAAPGDGPDYAATVAAWQEHLRAGGSTPWREVEPVTATGQPVPHASAVHLELVRRLDGSLPNFSGLADLVLGAALPGRGSIDVPLLWEEPARHGSPAVDPAQLGAEELLRLAAAVLAELAPRDLHPEPVRRGRRWARRFRVRGAPVLGEQVRSALLARGWRESAHGGIDVVIGVPVVEGFAQVWAMRVLAGESASWTRVWERQRDRGVLPASLRTAELSERANRTGGHVLAVTGPTADVRRDLAKALHLVLPEQPDLIAVDLARRVNAALRTRCSPAERRRLGPGLATMIGRSARPLTELDVPAPHRAWAAEAGYARPQTGVPSVVPAARTLDLALAAIGRGWTRRTGEVVA